MEKEIEELRVYCRKIDELVKTKGATTKYCEARYKAAQMYKEHGYKAFAYRQTLLAKNELHQIVKRNTRSISPDGKGFDLFELDDYCKEHGVETTENKLFWDILYLESQDIFDSYLLYLEKDREPKERFYYPKRDCLRKTGIVQGMQDLEDDVLNILTISMPPGTGKTTLLKFFATWVMGKRPDSYSIFYSHSDDITRMFYDGILDIIKSEEYKYAEIFPKAFIQNTNAKGQRINLNNYSPFETLQCTTVGAKNSGKVRVSGDGYLFCDDLIGGIEEALNKSRLDTLWGKYGTDARQRKKDGAKEIMIATRWSVHDCIGRLQLIYKADPKVRFIAVPGINKETGKSNFEYKVDGFSVEFYEDQKKCMDDISYKCLYDNEPLEREGILYHADELRRYTELPPREPDAIYCIGDVKNKGTDFMIFPVLAQYGKDYYCIDCVCDDDADFGIQKQKIANLFFRNKVQLAEFEANNGGDRFADDVDEVLKAMGGFTGISTKFTESNKETRIYANAPWVKANVLFKKESMYSEKEDYGVMMAWLCRYSVAGKNTHDDVPDAFANAALYFTRGEQKGTASAVFNPFRSNYQSAYINTGYCR